MISKAQNIPPNPETKNVKLIGKQKEIKHLLRHIKLVEKGIISDDKWLINPR